MAARKTGRRRATRGGMLPDQQVSGAVFLPDHLDQVRAIAMRGLSDSEMAGVFGIKPELIQAWKEFYPSFADAIEQGRTQADARVVMALYDNAVGFEYDDEELVKYKDDFEIVPVRRKKLPETAAQRYWLNNRQAAYWGEKSQLGGDRSPGAKPIGVKDETKMDVINSLLHLVTPKPDN